MAWETLPSHDFVDRSDLQDAVNKGYFNATGGVPAAEPDKWMNSGDVRTYVELDVSKLPADAAAWVRKFELVGIFPTIVTEFKPLASPRKLIYNPINGLLYFIDYDDPNYGLWYFDPATAKSVDDFTGIAGTSDATKTGGSMRFTDMVYSPDRNRLYLHGEQSGGMLVVDCATNQVIETIPYGFDAQFSRQNMILLGGNVWAFDSSAGAWQIISTATNAIVGAFDITLVPGYNQHASSVISFIEGKIWILLTSSVNPAIVRVYANVTVPDYVTDLVHSIDALGQQPTFNGKVEITSMYWDQAHHIVYFPSSGDNRIYRYDSVSYLAGASIAFPMEGKLYLSVAPVFRQTTGQLYFSGQLIDSVSDAGLKRTYEIDRAAGTIKSILNDIAYSSLVYAVSVDLNYASVPVLTFYNTPNTGYQGDGSIIALN